MKFFLFIVLLSFLFISCQSDDELQPLSIDGCSSGILEDDVAIENALVGIWRLTDSRCGLCGPVSKSERNKVTKAIFKADYRFMVLIDTDTITKGSWSVDEKESNTRVKLNPTSVYLTNSFSMCQSELLTEDLTVIDLFQNKFKKE